MSTNRAGPAHHEAAHAVAAWLCGYHVRASVDPTDPKLRSGAGGHCEILNPACSAEDQLLIALAPLAAGEDPGDCADDLIQAVHFAGELGDPVATLRNYWVGARNVLDLPRVREFVETIADELQERQTLGPDDVETILQPEHVQKGTVNRLNACIAFLARLRAFWGREDTEVS